MRIALSLVVLGLSACAGGPGDDGKDGDVDTSVEVIPGPDDDTGDPGEEVPARVPDVIVDCTGGADFLTIGDAIAGSRSGTKIGLNPCTYREDVDFIGKSLDIFGIEGSAVTFIEGSGSGAVVKANHGESVGTRLAGVTVSGGATAGYHGSGMSVDLAIVLVEDVVFTRNNVGYSVLYATGSFLEFLDVTYADNRVDPTGGIQVIDNGTYLAQRLTIGCTDADFAIYQHNAMILLDSDIDCGTQYGVYSAGAGAHVRRSRVESGGVGLYGGDTDDTRNERVWLWNSTFIGGDTAVSALYTHVKAENNVFWGGEIGLDLQHVHLESYVWNSAASGATCGFRTDAATTYDLGWNADLGADCGAVAHDSVTAAPGFVDAPDDFTLEATSPLIDAGEPDDDSEDVDGTRNDIGIYGGPEGQGQP
ncbi:MAG: hypothetical protein Q8P41_26535 [Pseudomonadota bacterium]|nr:hypothetical protein [Pseudomonadota bacterium]